MDSALATRNVTFAYQTNNVEVIDRLMLACFDAIKTDQYDYFLSSASVLENPDVRFIEINFNDVSCGIIMLVKNELHTLFCPPLRGRNAINAMKCALRLIWQITPFKELKSYAYSHHPEVGKFAKLMGAKPTQTYDDGTTINGVPVMRTDFVYPKP
jgi:hypothetical protein